MYKQITATRFSIIEAKPYNPNRNTARNLAAVARRCVRKKLTIEISLLDFDSSMASMERRERTLLNVVQSTARTAFIQFCSNLQLAIGHKLGDPVLSTENSKTIQGLLSRNNDDLAAEGERLWETLINLECHQTCAGVFTKESLPGLLSQLDKVRDLYEELEQYRASIAARVAGGQGDTPTGMIT